ncbi:MAG TPA: amidohydrolase family protein [Pseudolabrys sp.]|jgi:predicted TIM-barrel fold metal-dependent hydrolase|nr:amidohydrolase family protein [Pseudolabrys sp.]
MRCDSHVHIVGPTDRYPQVPNRTYLAGMAIVDDLESNAAPNGVTRFVIVQPSFYGTDNRLLLQSLNVLAGRGRGVAVIDQATSRQTILEFVEQGVRGLRLNLYSRIGDDTPLDLRFKAIEEPAHAASCHIEVIAPVKMFAENARLLARSRVPIVIDHYGLHSGHTPDDVEGRALLDLLSLPHVWIKLSAPYRNSTDDLATRPDPGWLAAILAVASDRCVWGSDWPHTPPHNVQMGSELHAPYRRLRYGGVLDGFIAAVGSTELAERILSDNPARLYEFQ